MYINIYHVKSKSKKRPLSTLLLQMWVPSCWLSVHVWPRGTQRYEKLSLLATWWAQDLLNIPTRRAGSQEPHSLAGETHQTPPPSFWPWTGPGLALGAGTSLSLCRQSTALSVFIFDNHSPGWLCYIRKVLGCQQPGFILSFWQSRKGFLARSTCWVSGWHLQLSEKWEVTQKCQAIHLALARTGHFLEIMLESRW